MCRVTRITREIIQKPALLKVRNVGLIGLLAGIYPLLLGFAFLLAPLALVNGIAALRHYDAPVRFCRVIRGAMLQYVLVTLLASVSYVCGG